MRLGIRGQGLLGQVGTGTVGGQKAGGLPHKGALLERVRRINLVTA